MAFRLPPRLAEVREAVSIRIRYGKQGTRSPQLRDTIDEHIRSAVAEIMREAAWAELRVRGEIALVDGESEYDFPDNMDPGRLERLIVVSQSGREYQLQADIQSHEREDFTRGDDPRSLPLRYEIVNEAIQILPAPNADEYVTLVFEGYTMPPEPRHNDDRIPLDKEIVIRWATALMKMDLGKADGQVTMLAARNYLNTLRPTQTQGSQLQIGGHFSRKFLYQQKRRNYRRQH